MTLGLFVGIDENNDETDYGVYVYREDAEREVAKRDARIAELEKENDRLAISLRLVEQLLDRERKYPK